MKKRKMNIALFLGGTSEERDISLKTGEQIFKALNKEKYNVKKIDPKFDLEIFFNLIKNKKVDLVFLGLHGRGGEDGAIQGMLETLRVPYTGSGVLGSVLAMRKDFSKQVFETQKIATPKYYIINKKDFKKDSEKILLQIKKIIKPDWVVKPAGSGSSYGISLAESDKELKKAIKFALSFSDIVLVEKRITGREYSVPVLGEEAFPVIEIRPKHDFFNYKSKYQTGECEEIVPAPSLSKKQAEKMQKLAVLSHNALGCKVYSRVDFVADKKGNFYVLEVNTLPGMTENSLLPKSARAQNITFSKLLDKIIQLSLKK